MAREDKPGPRDAEGELGDFVPVVFARSVEEAEEYRQLLDDHDIPAIVGDERQPGGTGEPPAPRKGFSRGVPVLVPEAMLDEAGEVIAEHDETDAFGLDKEDKEDEEDEEDEVTALGGTEPGGLEDDTDKDDEDEEDEDEDEEEGFDGEDLFDEEDEEDEGDKDDKAL